MKVRWESGNTILGAELKDNGIWQYRRRFKEMFFWWQYHKRLDRSVNINCLQLLEVVPQLK